MAESQGERQFRQDQPLHRGPMLIEASAGTGKTYALSNFVLRLLIEEKLPIQQILVVTFTRAAAAELRSRIRARIEETLSWLDSVSMDHGAKENPKRIEKEVLSHEDPVWRKLGEAIVKEGASKVVEFRQSLRCALEDFDSATMTTIHGFCQLVLGFSAFETGVDFDVALAESVDDLLQKVVDDFWTSQLGDTEIEWFSYLIDRFKVSRERLLNLAKNLEADPHIYVMPQASTPGGALTRWRESWIDFRKLWSSGAGEELGNELVEWAKQKQFRKPKEYNTRRPLKMVQATSEWMSKQDSEALPDAEMQLRVEYFSASKIAEAFLEPDQFPGHALAEAAQCCLQSGGEAFLWEFSRWAREEISRRKRKYKVMSFSDLLHRLSVALESPSTKTLLVEELSGRYQAALIDEFQDTDPIQWSIFQKLFVQPKKGWAIFVGDPKQSIYGFRGADINAYLQARLSSADRCYTMGENWRSDPSYIQALNDVFDRPDLFLHKDIQYPLVKAAKSRNRLNIAGLDWSPLHLRCFVPNSEAPVPGVSDPSHVNYDDRWCREHLHHVVAGDVVELLNSSTQLEEDSSLGPRNILPQDIAVLVRSNFQAETMQAALRQRGVPAVISGVGSVFHTEEAEAMQRLLDAWLQPGSAAKLRGVLVSVLFEKRAEDVLGIDDDGWNDWTERMHAWSQRWRRDGVAAALRQMGTEQRIPENLVGGRGGERRLSNWLHLCELLHLASEERRLGPIALRDWLQKKRLLDEVSTESELLRLESDAEAVTILTVHRSKGLEFGIVFCPYLWQGKQWRSNGLEHKQLRFHDRRHDHRLSLDFSMDSTIGPKAKHVQWAIEDGRAENMRLAYVALTRSRHACVVYWGAFPNCDESPLASLLRSRNRDLLGLGHSESGGVVVSPKSESSFVLWSQMDASQWRRELKGLVASSQECISLSYAQEQEPSFQDYRIPKSKHANIKVQQFGRSSIAPRWTKSSFSSLTATPAYAYHFAISEESRTSANAKDLQSDRNNESFGQKNGGWRSEIQDELLHAELATPAFDERTLWMQSDSESNAFSSNCLIFSEESNPPPLPFEAVPGGTRWGNHVHRILEQFDFSVLGLPGGNEALHDSVQALGNALAIDDPGRSKEVLRDFERGIAQVMRTPLGPTVDNLRLQDIQSCDRIHELRFDFPIANSGVGTEATPGITLKQIAAILQEEGSSCSPINSDYIQRLIQLGDEGSWREEIRGFMTGSIDLVFRQQSAESSRWFLVDYKSNRLHSRVFETRDVGEGQRNTEYLRQWEAYRPERLCAPMADHHYFLQYHIYLLALHRYLRSRMGSRYNYDRDFGGVLYLFVRGMAGDNPPVDEKGQPYGVFFDRPKTSVINRLDELMAGEHNPEFLDGADSHA